MKLAAVWALMLLLQAPLTQTQQQGKTPKGTIEGTVLRAGTGEPLPRAEVTLIRAPSAGVGTAVSGAFGDNGPASGRSIIPPASTDGEGKFAFTELEPGSYRIAVARNGYTRQEYGQHVFGGQGRVIALTAGQALREIAVHLVPAGNVSGVVRNPSGEPVAGFQVQLLRSSYGSTGQRTLQPVGADRTNDRGEFRVYWVTPGRYYLAVQSTPSALGLSILGVPSSANEVVERRYPLTYYPGTIDESRASVIDVQPGVDLNGIDVLLPQQTLFHVRGRVVDLGTGRPPQNASVSIAPRESAAPGAVLSGLLPAYNPANGSFDLGDVAPGSYWVRATVSVSTADAVVTASAAGRTLTDLFTDSVFLGKQTGQIPVDVSRSDVDGLVLVVSAGVSIPGRLTIEGKALTEVPSFESLRVALKPASPGTVTSPAPNQPMNPAGAFLLEDVLPGEYFVSVQPLPPEYYVKAAVIGQTDALSQPVLIKGPVSGTLDVVVSPKAGRIDGVVTEDRGRTAPGIQVVLVPDLNRNRVDLYKTTVTDETGRFTLQGISPGDYRVFAWEAVESFGYFDRDFLRQSENKGKSVRIVESSRENMDIRLIPATP